jgi:uncharacterized protein with von Willebrand factor type A (vWA) domain
VSAPGHLAENLTRFGRLLRDAGLPIGTDRILDALRTLEVVGLARRDDVYWALHAVFVCRRDQHAVFDHAFRLFWREPGGLEDALAALLPRQRGPAPSPIPRRLAEAWRAPRRAPAEASAKREPAASASERERLRHTDFGQMSAAELRRARELAASLRFGVAERPTRRLRPHPRGRRLDARRTLRAGLRSGGADIPLRWREPRRRPPPLVVLCDVSGSMQPYASVLLHFLHALANTRARVETFLFGTRLTRVTRALRQRDPELALGELGARLSDWSGGTRIGSCLREFNLRWARRLLAQGAVVLLVTDGLEREVKTVLATEAERLARACLRLVWLNPLLGFAGFEARAAGIRALLPHVDELRPAHDLASLEDLAQALGSELPRRVRA